jgi:hypothetical protein
VFVGLGCSIKTEIMEKITLVSKNEQVYTSPAVPIDGDGQVLHEGDRVYSYGYDDKWKPQRIYGTLHKNEDFPEVSEWYIAYDEVKSVPFWKCRLSLRHSR